jgi:hypothetical protein
VIAGVAYFGLSFMLNKYHVFATQPSLVQDREAR